MTAPVAITTTALRPVDAHAEIICAAAQARINQVVDALNETSSRETQAVVIESALETANLTAEDAANSTARLRAMFGNDEATNEALESAIAALDNERQITRLVTNGLLDAQMQIA